MKTLVHIYSVQQVSNTLHNTVWKCSKHLETRVQPALRLLNTCQTYAVCGLVTLESYPSRCNSRGGDFLSLNRETASCHTVAGTWLAPLWRVLALGHARTKRLTGQQVKENVSPLGSRLLHQLNRKAGDARQNSGNTRQRKPRRAQADHSEDCGFLSLFRQSLFQSFKGVGGFSLLFVFVLLLSYVNKLRVVLQDILTPKLCYA